MSSLEPNSATHDARIASSRASPGWLALVHFLPNRHLPLFVLGLVVAIVSGVVPPALAIILGRLFNQLTVQDYEQTSRDCIALVCLGCISWIANTTFFAVWRTIGDVQAHECRTQVFETLIHTSMAWFDLREEGARTLLTTVHAQIKDMYSATTQPAGFAFQYSATALAALGVALYYSWSVTLITLASIPVLALVLGYLNRSVQPSIRQQQQVLATAARTALHAFGHIETVKCCNSQAQELAKYKRALALAASHYSVQCRTNALQTGFVKFITVCMFVQGFAYGSNRVRSGSATPGTIVTAFWACLQAAEAVQEFMPQIMVLQRGVAAVHALKDLVCPVESPTVANMQFLRGITTSSIRDIELRQVSFAYPKNPQHLVLKEFSCHFAAGEVTFIIGASGSGKSTLAKLLIKLYASTTGEILIDGISLEQYDAQWIRRNITVVAQYGTIFRGDILSNVALATYPSSPSAYDILDINEAVKFAQLAETVDLMPQGLHTDVGPSGRSLSGGQRQRLEIARARLRDTPVLILDEPTSALDPELRSVIMERLRAWRTGRTTIIISHDPDLILDQDYVYVMNNGECLEEGYASTLKAKDTWFGSRMDKSGSNWKAGCGENLHNDKKVDESAAPMSYGPNCKPLDHWAYSGDIGVAVPCTRKESFSTELNPETGSFSSGSPTLRYSKLVSSTLKQNLSTFDAASINGKKFAGPQCRDSLELEPLDAQGQRVSHGSLSGVAQSQDSAPLMSIREILSTVWSRLSSITKLFLVIGLGMAVCTAALTPVFAWMFSQLLETLYGVQNSSSTTLHWSLLLLSVAMANAIATFLMRFLLEYCAQTWVDQIRIEAFRRILNQEFDFFAKGRNSADTLTHILDRPAEDMRNLLGRFTAYMVVAAFMTLLAIAWSLSICWQLTLVTLATAPALYCFTRVFESVSIKMERALNDAAADEGGLISEIFSNLSAVRTYTLEDYFRSCHDTMAACCQSKGWRYALLGSPLFGLADASVLFVQAVIFYYGSRLMQSGAASLQDCLTVFSLLLFSLAEVTSIVQLLPQIAAARDGASQLLALSNLPDDSHEQVGTLRPRYVGDLHLYRLTHRYPLRPHQTVLDRISLRFRRGSTTAIVGHSGSGKSSIAALLLRLYPVERGRMEIAPPISLGGHDINSLDVNTLRQLVAIVPQNPIVFPGTVSENILYGIPNDSPSWSHHLLYESAKAAGIHEFISMLPSGYETVVGDGGIGLSGGQIQRLAIARALARTPDILILDEATSALDVDNARLVKASVQRLRRQCKDLIVIVITHHHDLLDLADNVVVLDRGRVAHVTTSEDFPLLQGLNP